MGKAERNLKMLRTAVAPKAKIVKMSLCSVSFVILTVKTIALILFYYIFSIGLTFYNQRFIHHFKYPLSLTMCHLVVKFMMAWLIRGIISCKTGESRLILPWGEYCKRMAPAGIASALDIGLSNWSFEFITVSLYTMSKTSATIFILLFALVLKLEKWRWSLVLVVMFIVSGLFMFTYHSTQFNAEGFGMVIVASFLSGIRWTLAQILLQRNEIGLQNPVDMMFHIQPWMVLGLLPLSYGFEGISIATTDQLFRFSDDGVLSRNLALVLFGALLAFMLEFSEFLLLSQTSSLTLSISGIFKEVCTLYLATRINGDKMNLVNGIGLIVCLIGIALHVVLKAIHRREETRGVLEHIEEVEMLRHDGQANISADEDDEEEIFNARHDR